MPPASLEAEAALDQRYMPIFGLGYTGDIYSRHVRQWQRCGLRHLFRYEILEAKSYKTSGTFRDQVSAIQATELKITAKTQQVIRRAICLVGGFGVDEIMGKRLEACLLVGFFSRKLEYREYELEIEDDSLVLQ